jgi:hypothetical protein
VSATTPMREAWRLAFALGCNLIPTTIRERRPYEDWAGLDRPSSPRVDQETLERWVRAEAAEIQRGRERTAWALLPGSGRVAVVGCDSAEWTARWQLRAPTPLVVVSPSAGRAHLYYRWPDGCDVSTRCNVAGVDSYDLKGRGGTIHAPGSLHRSGRGRYAIAGLSEGEICEGLRDRLPVLDLALVEADAATAGRRKYEASEGACDFDRWSQDGEGERRFAAYVAGVEPAGQGARQSTLYKLAGKAGDLGVTPQFAAPLLREWCARCSPPLPETEAVECLERAYRNRLSAIGCDLGEDVSHLGEWDDEDDLGV